MPALLSVCIKHCILVSKHNGDNMNNTVSNNSNDNSKNSGQKTLWTDNQSEQWKIKRAFAEMLKGGVIMDVTNVEEARIAESSGAQAVMALERVPSDIRRDGGIARMSDPEMITAIQKAVSIPVMAKCRIGHMVEAEILQALNIDVIDESEVLTPADDKFHVYKHNFTVPFVCGCTNLGEALRRIGEGAVLIRTKGEAGTGDIVEAVTHMRTLISEIKQLSIMREDELMTRAKALQAPFELVYEIAKTGVLPVPNFSAGGIATPADAALMCQLGAEAVFVGSGIFRSETPEKRAKAIVEAVANYDNPEALAKISSNLGAPMSGISVKSMDESQKMSGRGW